MRFRNPLKACRASRSVVSLNRRLGGCCTPAVRPIVADTFDASRLLRAAFVS
jgi:hypothetical protein